VIDPETQEVDSTRVALLVAGRNLRRERAYFLSPPHEVRLEQYRG